MRSANSLRCTVALVAPLLLVANCVAQCGPLGCFVAPVENATSAQRAAFASVVRVVHTSAGETSLGSGVVVRNGADGAYVLTCAHLFETSGKTTVAAAGERYGASVVAVDRRHDLALLQARGRPAPAVRIARAGVTGVLAACGFGPNGAFRHVSGRVVGSAIAQGAESPSLRIRGAVRQGDSGGPVFDSTGRLVAVVWGCRDGETFAMGGPPLLRMLARLPSARPLTPIARRERDPVSVERGDDRLRAIERAVSDLSSRVQSSIADAESARRGMSERLERRLDSFERRVDESAAKPFVERVLAPPVKSVARDALLQLGGPAAVAAVVAAWWVRRRRSARLGSISRESMNRGASAAVAVDSPPPPQRVVPETHYVSYEKDDFALAHQWASEQISRKFPGAVELLTSLDSLIRQKLNSSARS